MTKLMNACAAVDQQQAIKLATTAIALAPETMKSPVTGAERFSCTGERSLKTVRAIQAQLTLTWVTLPRRLARLRPSLRRERGTRIT